MKRRFLPLTCKVAPPSNWDRMTIMNKGEHQSLELGEPEYISYFGFANLASSRLTLAFASATL